MLSVRKTRPAEAGRLILGTLAGAFLAGIGTAPARAADNVFDPSSFAFANTFGAQGNQASTQIRNGVVGETYDQTGGSAVSTSVSLDGYTNNATIVSNTGNTATATANLQAGTLRAFIGLGNGPVARGFAQARLTDTVFFSNLSGAAVVLPFAFSFDGQITDPSDFGSTASAIFTISGGISACPDGSFGGCFGDYSLLLQGGGSVNNTTVIGYAGNGIFNGVQQGGAFVFNAPDSVDLANYSVLKQTGPAAGYYNTVVSSFLVLPTGRSRLGFDLRLLMDCGSAGTVCDFGNTTRFSFGSLPTGLSFTSASGVFLNDPMVGGIPEPATWAMLIAGFGLTGAMQRRRRPAVAAA